MGALIMSESEFESYNETTVEDMAVTILFSVLLAVVIFITDILYQLIDPRVRVEGSHE